MDKSLDRCRVQGLGLGVRGRVGSQPFILVKLCTKLSACPTTV